MQLRSAAPESAWQAVFIQVYLSPCVCDAHAYVNTHLQITDPAKVADTFN